MSSMPAETDQISPSPVSGDQQKSQHPDPELLEESGSGKGKVIECEMGAEVETKQTSSPQDVPSPVPGDQQVTNRRANIELLEESGSGKGKVIECEMGAEMEAEQTSSPQDVPSSVPGGQQLNPELLEESGSGKGKVIECEMGAEMETGQTSSPQDVPSPVPGDQRKSRWLTLVLLGESGSGKSASGNTILGMQAFTSEPSSILVTTECETQTKSVCGTEVKVIDTPDFFDEDLQQQSRHILRCRELCEGGLCVYLLVIQIGRFTEGERDILERLEKALDTRVRDRVIILFTRGDDLTSHINDYVRDTTPHLKELIMKCGGRYQVFNNTVVTQQPNEKDGKWWFRNRLGSNTTGHKTEAEKQVKELMDKISELV